MRPRSAAFDAAVRALTPFTVRVWALDRDLQRTAELTGYAIGGQVSLDRARGCSSRIRGATSGGPSSTAPY